MLTNNEMLNINGGAINWSLIGLIGSALTLLAGIIDGYLRPLTCNK